MSDSMDIKTRLALVEELNESINQRNVLSTKLDARESGELSEGIEGAVEAQDEYKTAEYEEEKLDRALSTAKASAEIIEEKIGEEAVAHPNNGDAREESDRYDALATAAVATAATLDSPGTALAVGYVVDKLEEKKEIPPNPLGETLGAYVRNPDDPEDAKEIVEAYQEADRNIDDVVRETERTMM